MLHKKHETPMSGACQMSTKYHPSMLRSHNPKVNDSPTNARKAGNEDDTPTIVAAPLGDGEDPPLLIGDPFGEATGADGDVPPAVGVPVPAPVCPGAPADSDELVPEGVCAPPVSGAATLWVVAIAAVWKAAKDFAGVSFTEKTMPC